MLKQNKLYTYAKFSSCAIMTVHPLYDVRSANILGLLSALWGSMKVRFYLQKDRMGIQNKHTYVAQSCWKCLANTTALSQALLRPSASNIITISILHCIGISQLNTLSVNYPTHICTRKRGYVFGCVHRSVFALQLCTYA